MTGDKSACCAIGRKVQRAVFPGGLSWALVKTSCTLSSGVSGYPWQKQSPYAGSAAIRQMSFQAGVWLGYCPHDPARWSWFGEWNVILSTMLGFSFISEKTPNHDRSSHSINIAFCVRKGSPYRSEQVVFGFSRTPEYSYPRQNGGVKAPAAKAGGTVTAGNGDKNLQSYRTNWEFWRRNRTDFGAVLWTVVRLARGRNLV